jgi:hypothetical protein
MDRILSDSPPEKMGKIMDFEYMAKKRLELPISTRSKFFGLIMMISKYSFPKKISPQETKVYRQVQRPGNDEKGERIRIRYVYAHLYLFGQKVNSSPISGVNPSKKPMNQARML